MHKLEFLMLVMYKPLQRGENGASGQMFPILELKYNGFKIKQDN